MKSIFTFFLLITTCIAVPFVICAQKPANAADSLVLVHLYNSTKGQSWSLSSGYWLVGPVQNWYGVALDTGGRVLSLSLFNRNLSGSLPPDIGSLGNLTGLDLSYNHIGDSIPVSLGSLANLQNLNLSNNNISYSLPVQLGSLTSIQNVNLGNNNLSGAIPSSFGNLANLQTLDLSYNQLSGSIPSSITNLTNLQGLSLFYNKLSGTIPALLGGLTKLTNLDLYNNKLTGAIPSSLGSLPNLKDIELSHNQITGTIPPELGSLANLQVLWLDNNKLDGSIPATFGGLTNLTYLWLNNNQLTGSIPLQLGTLASLQYLHLNNNQLGGTIPAELGNLGQLRELYLNNNQLSGPIPANFGNLANLQSLLLNYNHLSSLIPSQLGNLGNLYSLTLDNNYFTFDGMELIAENYNFAVYAPQDTILPLHFINTKLSVSSGGTLSNNTYKWYKNNAIQQAKTGDSTYLPTAVGSYSATITNAVATALTLYSDTLTITGAELPVTLLNFMAKLTEQGSQLNWQTATEVNSGYFNVQRSTTGGQFTTIGKINASGNSSMVNSYTFTDAFSTSSLLQNELYYRLAVVDKNGATNYSKIVTLNLSGANRAIKAMPNPVKDCIYLYSSVNINDAVVTLADLTGKVLTRLTQNVTAANAIKIPCANIPSGIYMLTIENAGTRQQIKIFKQ